ncbi:MAG: hypothetical protein ACE5JS_11355 [Nitrospinota bacterium]
MRYHISGRIRPGKKDALRKGIRDATIGRGKIFHEGMQAGLQNARVDEEERVHFIEVCYCLESGLDPMQMELPSLRPYFDDLEVNDARRRKACTMECEACDCTRTYRLPGGPLTSRLGLDEGELDGEYVDAGRIPLNRKKQKIGIDGLREALGSGAEAWAGGAAVKGFYVIFLDGDEFFRVKHIPDTKEARALLRKTGLNHFGSVEGARSWARGSLAARDDKSNVA